MYYIMASNSFKSVMDNSNVHYSFSWGNSNWSIFKINEELPVFLNKVTEKWRTEYGSNIWCNTPPDGCLYAGLWNETTYNVNGHMMTGFVNEDIVKTPELKARFEEEKYKNLSDWLSRVMQMDTNVSCSDDMSEIGDLYAVITYLSKVNKVGGIKKFLEKYEGESITEDELDKIVREEEKNMPSKNENTEINDKKTVHNVSKVVEHILECDDTDVREFMKNQAERLRKLRTLHEESTANKVINDESGGDNKCKVSDIDVERTMAAAAKIIADEMVKQLGSDFSMQVARGVMDSTYGMDHNYFTWGELFDKAVSNSFLSDELKAKDNARSAMRDVILDETGVDIDKSESAEDEIEKFLKESNITYYFDESGNIAHEVIK